MVCKSSNSICFNVLHSFPTFLESRLEVLIYISKVFLMGLREERTTVQTGYTVELLVTCKEERGQIIPAVILATAAFMAIVGKAKGSTVDIRLVGMGIPALAHIAAALALAISNNWSLSRKI